MSETSAVTAPDITSPVPKEVSSLLKSNVNLIEIAQNQYDVSASGSAIFFNYIPLERKLDKLPCRATLVADLSQCKLVDPAVMHRLCSYTAEYARSGATTGVEGL